MADIQTDSKLVERLNIVFNRSGLSILEFAKSINVDRTQFGRVLKGDVGITLKQIIEVSSQYNVRIGWLLDGEEPMLKNKESDLQWKPDPLLLTQVKDEIEALRLSLRRLSESLPALPQEENTDQGNAYEALPLDKIQKVGKR